MRSINVPLLLCTLLILANVIGVLFAGWPVASAAGWITLWTIVGLISIIGR